MSDREQSAEHYELVRNWSSRCSTSLASVQELTTEWKIKNIYYEGTCPFSTCNQSISFQMWLKCKMVIQLIPKGWINVRVHVGGRRGGGGGKTKTEMNISNEKCLRKRSTGWGENSMQKKLNILCRGKTTQLRQHFIHQFLFVTTAYHHLCTPAYPNKQHCSFAQEHTLHTESSQTEQWTLKRPPPPPTLWDCGHMTCWFEYSCYRYPCAAVWSEPVL